MTTTVLRIEGMSCDHCVRTLIKVIEGLEGVSRAEVSLEEQRAIIEHEEGTPTLSELVGAVEEEGYNATGD